MTGKINECPFEIIEDKTTISCDEPSCDGFKDLYEKLDDEIPLEPLISNSKIPPSIFDLVKEAIIETRQEKVLSISPVNLAIINELSETVFVKAVSMIKQGIIESSFVITSDNPLIDKVEIKLISFDTAHGFFNLEINSCDKLEALLHRHVESLHESLALSSACFKVERVEVNGKQLSRSKERIDGSTSKKVSKAK